MFSFFPGTGCSTAFIRVFAALRLASDLKTITSEAVRQGISTSVDTGRDLVECLKEAADKELEKLPTDFYLDATKK